MLFWVLHGLKNVNIDKTVIFSKVSFGKKGFKFFIGYKDDDDKIKPLCIMNPQTCGYVKFETIKVMSFLIKDEQLLKKCNKI